MRNRFPGTCYRCGQQVAVGKGHFERNQGKWRTQHAECAIFWRGKNPSIDDAAKRRNEFLLAERQK